MPTNEAAAPHAGTVSESATHHIQNARMALHVIAQTLDLYTETELRAALVVALATADKRMLAAVAALGGVQPAPVELLEHARRHTAEQRELLQDPRVRDTLARIRSQRGGDAK